LGDCAAGAHWRRGAVGAGWTLGGQPSPCPGAATAGGSASSLGAPSPTLPLPMGIREFPGGAPKGKSIAIGMRRSPDVSPRRLSDISPQLRQLKYLVVDEAIKEDLKWSRSVEDLTSGPVGLTSIEERILRITGYYGYQPWAASYRSKTPPLVYLLAGPTPLELCQQPGRCAQRCARPPSPPPPLTFLSADTDLGLQLLARGLETIIKDNGTNDCLHGVICSAPEVIIRLVITSRFVTGPTCLIEIFA
ncbi:hypothetical protein MC885_004027, partial [Smutsia gigantea]